MGDGDDSATSSHQGSRPIGPLTKKQLPANSWLAATARLEISMGRLVELGNFWPGVTDEDIEFPGIHSSHDPSFPRMSIGSGLHPL